LAKGENQGRRELNFKIAIEISTYHTSELIANDGRDQSSFINKSF